MRRIKTIGFFILLILVVLIFLASIISDREQKSTETLNLIHTQKSYAQEISKSLFYAHRYKKVLPKNLDRDTYRFMENLHHVKEKNGAIEKLSQEFFTLVNQFRYVHEGNVPYNIIILDKLVNDIYKKNMELVVAFTHHAKKIKVILDRSIQSYRTMQYTLFVLLLLLLLYLFTQMDEIMKFVQKFTKTSNRIIEESSIKGLKPIEIHSANNDLDKATGNFNTLVEHIDTSIKAAADSMAHTTETLETVETHIEQLVSLLHDMQHGEKEKLYEKEDTLIESLETLMALTKYLENLKNDLKKLV